RHAGVPTFYGAPRHIPYYLGIRHDFHVNGLRDTARPMTTKNMEKLKVAAARSCQHAPPRWGHGGGGTAVLPPSCCGAAGSRTRVRGGSPWGSPAAAIPSGPSAPRAPAAAATVAGSAVLRAARGGPAPVSAA